MATVARIECARCHRTAEREGDLAHAPEGWTTPLNVDDIFTDIHVFDRNLCPDCSASLKAWWEQGVNEGGFNNKIRGGV